MKNDLAAATEPSRDPLAVCLEIGLAAVVVGAPLPLAAVPAPGRLALEIAAFALLLVWLVRAIHHPSRLPSRWVCIGLAGLIALAAIQLLPLGARSVSALSPQVARIESATTPPPEVLEIEERLLGADPRALRNSATLSLDPAATASALRTGAALAALLVVACTVAAVRGVRRIIAALSVAVAFQGLYGLLVLASGHNRIWHLPKEHYLNAATGTFVNKNHFACYLALGLACGTALLIRHYRRAPRRGAHGLVRLFSAEGGRGVVLALCLILALAGLLASFSRAGIALGLAAVAATAAAGGGARRLPRTLVIVLLAFLVALVPLLQIGSDRLVGRYQRSVDDLVAAGQRAMVWGDSIRMALDYPLAGSGFGTFASVYPLYRSPEVRLHYSHAHNDLIQLAAEGGIAGLAFCAMLLIPLLGTISRALAGAKGVLALGLAAALTAFLLHSLVDFNVHIPANAATAAVLAGALQGLPWKTPR